MPEPFPLPRAESRPMVTVVMPVHCEEPDRLARAVRSVLSQDVPLELLLVSDDGMDYAHELPSLLNGADGRIRYLTTGAVGAGPSAARNVALDVAAGDTIAFLDSDDFMAPEKLALMVPLARAYGVAFDNTRYEFEPGDEAGGVYCPGATAGYRPLSFFADIPWPLIAVYNRRRFPSARFARDVRFGEDILFNLLLLACNGGAYFVDRPLHHYVVRTGSLSHGPDCGEDAERSYTHMLRHLHETKAPAMVIEAVERKRSLNLAYLAWSRSGGVAFHEYIRDAATPALVASL